VVVEHHPEGIFVDHGQIGYDRNKDKLLAFFMQGPHHVMMINHVVIFVWTQHHWNHTASQKLGTLL